MSNTLKNTTKDKQLKILFLKGYLVFSDGLFNFTEINRFRKIKRLNSSADNIKVKKHNFSFKKNERLCSRKIIGELFLSGNSFLVYPLKFVFLETQLPVNNPVQVGFSVSKKNFKRAVHRNLLKRKMKEAYRLNKAVLYEELKSKQLAVFIIFIAKEIQDYHTVEQAMIKGLKRLGKTVVPKNKRQ